MALLSRYGWRSLLGNHAFLGAGLAVALATTACRDNQDPEGAADLWNRVQASGYRAFPRPRGYAVREPSFTLHGGSVDIFLNPTLAAASKSPVRITEWPIGSMIIKDGYSGKSDSLSIVAVMEKQADGWYFAEYSGDGEVLFSGKPKVCTDCHDARKDYSDWLFSLEMPR